MGESMSPADEQALSRELSLVQRLLELPEVSKHETTFETEVALVAAATAKEQVDALVEEVMAAPVKPADRPLEPDFSPAGLLAKMGGVRTGQSLYLKQVGGRLLLYVAYWPWGNGARFTIKIGVYEQGEGSR